MGLKRSHLDLVVYKAYAELKTEISRYTIGILWWFLDPVLYMAIFYVVFTVLELRGRPGDFVYFLLAGLVTWRWFARAVATGSESVFRNRSLMQSVYLPKWIFPVSSMLADFLRFLIVLAVFLVFLWFNGFYPSQAYLAIPLLIGVQILVIAAFVLLLAVFVPVFPDIKMLISHAMLMMFWVSGIFFAGSQVPDEYKFYFYLNPMANLIESWRDVLLYQAWPDLRALGKIAALSTISALPGVWLLVRLDRRLPKLVAEK